jgi:serine protease
MDRRVFALLIILTLGILASRDAIAGSVSTISIQAGGASTEKRAAEQYNQLIVKFRDGDKAAMMIAIRSAYQRMGRSDASVLPTQYKTLSLGMDVIRFPSEVPADHAKALVRELRRDTRFDWVMIDAPMELLGRGQASAHPNDPDYAHQWYLHDAVGGINVPPAWALSRGEGMTIAVIDSGYVQHYDLSANLLPGYDLVEDADYSGDGDGIDPDARDEGGTGWHGAHVAGIATAIAHNGQLIAGVAPQARILPVRVADVEGKVLTSAVLNGIVWAVGGDVPGLPLNPHTAEVINLSLAMVNWDEEGAVPCSARPNGWVDVVYYALSKGVAIVAGAGNGFLGVHQPAELFVPASCPGVITVAGTTRSGTKAGYSNYSSQTIADQYGIEPVVDIAAPGGKSGQGEGIWSLVNRGANFPLPSPGGDDVAEYFGTSMATPQVAATVALMQSARARIGKGPLAPQDIREILAFTARVLPEAPPDDQLMGAGIVNAGAAVEAALVWDER